MHLDRGQDIFREKEAWEREMLRTIRRAATKREMEETLQASGMTDLPGARYRDGSLVPGAFLQWILYSYLSQWKEMAGNRAIPHPVASSDEIAERLLPEDLAGITGLPSGSLQGADDPAAGNLPSILLRSPQRLLPFLRYAAGAQLGPLLHAAEASGIAEIRQAVRQGIVLNDSIEAARYVIQKDLIQSYGLSRGLSRGEMMEHFLVLGDDGLTGAIRERYLGVLQAEWISGKGRLLPEWEKDTSECRIIRALRENLLWGYRDVSKEGVALYRKGAFRGSEGERIPLTDRARIRLAHPAEMPEHEVRRWQRCLADAGVETAIPQLSVPVPSVMRQAERRWQGRYANLVLPEERFRMLAGTDVRRIGTRDRQSLTYRGKQVLEMKPLSDGISLSPVQIRNFNRREWNHLFWILDGLCYPELVRRGALPVREQEELLTDALSEELLVACIEAGHSEQVAELMAWRREHAKASGNVGSGAADADLEW